MAQRHCYGPRIGTISRWERCSCAPGADANAANDFKMTPLAQACTNGNAEFVDLLLKAGANPNTPIGTGETPLMTCARAGNADAVRMLLVHGADANAREPNQNQTALMWAAAQQHPNVLQLLIETGADLKAHTKTGFTALHFAARVGDMESTRTLLDAGVDVNIKSQPDRESGRGQGAGGVAAGAGSAAAAPGRGGAARGGAVVGGGAGARAGTNFPGSTALLVATVRGKVPLALFLLDRGADPNVVDAGFSSASLGRGHVGKRTGQPRLRVCRSDRRDSGSRIEAAARQGTAGARRRTRICR